MTDLHDDVHRLEFHMLFSPSRLIVYGVTRRERVALHIETFDSLHIFTQGGDA